MSLAPQRVVLCKAAHADSIELDNAAHGARVHAASMREVSLGRVWNTRAAVSQCRVVLAGSNALSTNGRTGPVRGARVLGVEVGLGGAIVSARREQGDQNRSVHVCTFTFVRPSVFANTTCDALVMPRVQMTAAEQLRRAKQLVDVMSGAAGVDLWSKAMETP